MYYRRPLILVHKYKKESFPGRFSFSCAGLTGLREIKVSILPGQGAVRFKAIVRLTA